MNKRVFNKNFVMVIIGQMVSIFGNSVLRFALPLFILDETGSTAIFGSVLAVSAIPVILFSPVGGILADRVNKRNMMVVLDTITAIIISIFSFTLGCSSVVILIAAMMVILSLIQSIYQPVVQASIPVIAHKDNLEQANAVVGLVNAFSNLLAPVAAGFLYGALGIVPIMITGIVCFFLAAFMEMFIKITVAKQKKYDNIKTMVKADFKESLHYIVKDNPILLKAMFVVAGLNLLLSSVIIIGVPAMIKIKLNLGDELYGTAQGITALGMIAGGILISVIGKRIQTKQVYVFLVLASLTLVPIGLAFMFNLSAMTIYWVISVSCFLMMICITLFSITMNAFVQRETPENLIGKVISYIMVFTQCSLPIGQALYGYLFEIGINSISVIVLVTAFLSGCVALYSKVVFGKLEEKGVAA